MKLHFLMPGRELANGLLFLYDDAGCVKMSEHTTHGGVADIYVEYQGEEEPENESSGSDFEEEIISLGDSDDREVPEVLTAEADGSGPIIAGVITQVMSSPRKSFSGTGSKVEGSSQQREVLAGNSQVINTFQHSQVANHINQDLVLREDHTTEEKGEEYSESEEDSDYVAHSDDSGEESEVVDLRKKAKQFKKKMRASRRWVDGENASGAVPIDLVANVEEVLEEINKEDEFDSSDEDYSYDEEDGDMVRRKSRYPRFNPDSEIPIFSLTMVFKSKQQLCKAIKRYGLVTKRSLSFMKSEVDRIRVKCDWSGCPWLLYAAKTSRCSRFQIITLNDDHHCAQNRDNHLVTAKVIAKRYEHFILANPTWNL